MELEVVQLDVGTTTEHAHALEEVKQFSTTDLDLGGEEWWTYQLLPEPTLVNEITRLANPQVRGCVDCVSFQPCPLYELRSQDRYCVEYWDMPGGTWTFSGVFDGHAGHSTVDYVVATIPVQLKHSLMSQLEAASEFTPEAVMTAMSEAIVECDTGITTKFMALFPEGELQIASTPDETIVRKINDDAVGGQGHATTLRCTQGSTVLISLTDPRKENLYLANLGDCQAILGSHVSTGVWCAREINSPHNGDNMAELNRVRDEHPGERECVGGNRVLGFLAPTRAIGDTWLKLPSVYTQRIFLNLAEDWMPIQDAEKYVGRLLTPPYVSNQPDVHHLTLGGGSLGNGEHFLIMATDGLADLFDGWQHQAMLEHWVEVVGRSRSASTTDANSALWLLRDGLGGEDTRKVSQYLTLEMEERWMDDVTILVQHIW
ncbi:hypothetical protein JAAARDRAFT_156361 [Jaapia argillacea MUCL 33604]|uniref:PPM-type phosphatase domain-containing protein n=1 Tax=Jaapia argillacea MUCL 33604 TaxID=933084 RepID=A0A067Q4P6_9AGAM|nr:hypothetical protein JAAARDRAFT_156361 [Jaapia argillacea MUCL 33604]